MDDIYRIDRYYVECAKIGFKYLVINCRTNIPHSSWKTRLEAEALVKHFDSQKRSCEFNAALQMLAESKASKKIKSVL